MRREEAVGMLFKEKRVLVAVLLFIFFFSPILFGIQVTQAAVDKVICIPWQGNPAKYHTTWSGYDVYLKGVIKTDSTATIWYKWDYGDGVTALSKKEVHTFSTPGIFTVVLQVVDNDLYTGTAQKVIKVLDRPLPPIDVESETMANRTAFYTDYVNTVTWESNPENSSLFTIANHRIYRKTQGQDDSQYTQVSEVSGTTFEYMDSGLGGADKAVSYVYTVTCVDDQGNESLVVSQLGSSSSPIRNTAREIERIKK